MGAIVFKKNKYGGNTDVTDGNHVIVDNGSGSNVTAQQMYNNILNDISTVETTSTASKNYVVDEHLIYNGLLYKVTATIAQGDTLVVGTNITRVNITDQLSDSGDSVVEYNSYSAFPATGESGTLYIDISTNIVYRWDGTGYVEITSGQSGAVVVSLTQAQYNALTPAEQNNGTIYMITDGTDGWLASDSIYINTTSGLSATNVQDAIDELASDSGSLPPVTASDNGKILQVTNGEWTDVDQVISVQDMMELRSLLNPEIGKFYYVVQNGIAYLYNGQNFIAINTPINPLPYVTSSDDGKFLQVVNGQWAAATIPSANGVSF